VELDTNIHHVSGHYCKGFQGQRSKVKVMYVEICECHNGASIHLDSGVNAYLFYFHCSSVTLCVKSVACCTLVTFMKLSA